MTMKQMAAKNRGVKMDQLELNVNILQNEVFIVSIFISEEWYVYENDDWDYQKFRVKKWRDGSKLYGVIDSYDRLEELRSILKNKIVELEAEMHNDPMNENKDSYKCDVKFTFTKVSKL